MEVMGCDRFDSLLCVAWFSVLDLGHSDFSRFCDYDSWEARNFDSNFGLNYEKDFADWTIERCENGSTLIEVLGWDLFSEEVEGSREWSCGVQLVTLGCRVGSRLWSRNVVHNGDLSIPDAFASWYGSFGGGMVEIEKDVEDMMGGRVDWYDGRMDLHGKREKGIFGLSSSDWFRDEVRNGNDDDRAMGGVGFDIMGLCFMRCDGMCGGGQEIFGLSNSDWLRNDVHNGNYDAHAKIMVGSGATELYLLRFDGMCGHGCGVVLGAAALGFLDEPDVGDWFDAGSAGCGHLDGGSLEGPESHLRVVRTPADFWV